MTTALLPLPSAHTRTALPRSLVVFALLYLLAWVLVPPLLAPSFPLDVVESLGWGREWQWGYYKHPPLPPIALHVFYLAFGRAGPFVLSQLCVALTLWLVWLTALRLVTRERALLATVLTMGVAFYTRPTLEFNHNIAQMPFWAAIAYFYLAAWQDQRRWQWLALGLAAGLGLLCKYSMGFLLLCLALFTVLTPARRLLKHSGPWLALLVLLLVIAPHVYWLQHHDWLPFAYAHDRGAIAAAGTPQMGAVRFLLTQGLNHAPLALVLLVACAIVVWRSPQQAGTGTLRLHCTQPLFLLVLALGPGLLLALLGMAGVRLRDMWGVPMWPFSGLLAAALLPDRWLRPLRPLVLRGMAVWLIGISILSGTYLLRVHELRHRPVRTDWPAAALAQQAQATWAGLSTCPLDLVAGEVWLAGLIAIDAHGQPSVVIPGDPRYSPWGSADRVLQRGALEVWQPEDAPDGQPAPVGILAGMDQRSDMQLHTGRWQIPWPRAQAQQPLEVQWRAYVPQACAKG